MKIAVDVMGFENDISEAINACEDFILLHNDLEIILVGNEQEIKSKLKINSKLKIKHSNTFVTQDDTVFSLRNKKDNSMQVAANMLKNNDVDGLLSAGNTSIFVFIMYSTIGMINGINKIGFMPTIPTINNNVFNLIDVGASIDVNSDDLVKFAIMANIFAKQRVENPKVAILNIGIEEHKGKELQRETNELLKKTNVNYIGYVESKNLLNYVADVVVTDAFSGNLVLKACEGTFKTIANELKKEYKKPWNFLATLTNLPIIKKLKKSFDYKNNAGAFVMGLNNVCVKTHGSADKKQFLSSLRMLYDCISKNVINKIKTEINEYETKNTYEK